MVEVMRELESPSNKRTHTFLRSPQVADHPNHAHLAVDKFDPPKIDRIPPPPKLIIKKPRRITWPTRFAALVAVASAGTGAVANTGVVPEAKNHMPVAEVVIAPVVTDFCFDAPKGMYNNGSVISFRGVFRECFHNTSERRPINVFNGPSMSALVVTVDFLDLDSGLPIDSGNMHSLLAYGQGQADLGQIMLGIEEAHIEGVIPNGPVLLAHDGNGYVDAAVTGVPTQFMVSDQGTTELPSS